MKLTESDMESVRRNAYDRWRAAGSPPSDGIAFWLGAEVDFLRANGADGQFAVDALSANRAPVDLGSTQSPEMRARTKPDKELVIGSRG